MEALAAILSLSSHSGPSSGSEVVTAPTVVSVLGSFADELEAARAEIVRLQTDNEKLGKALTEMFQIALVP